MYRLASISRNRKLCGGGGDDRVVRDQVLYSNKCARKWALLSDKIYFPRTRRKLALRRDWLRKLEKILKCVTSNKVISSRHRRRLFLLFSLSLSLSLFLFLLLFHCRDDKRLTFIDAPRGATTLSIISPSNFMKTRPFSFRRN